MQRLEDTTIGKKYKSGKISTSNINNFREVSDYKFNKLNEIRDFKFEEFSKRHERELDCINQSHVEKFTETFGERNFTYRNEYLLSAWLVEHNGCEAIIFSGKGKGTFVEVVLDEQGNPKGNVFNFFKEFLSVVQTFID